MILPFTALFGAVLLSNRVFSASLWQFYLFYAALGFFVHGLGPVPYGFVISHWFDRRRGLALGLMMLGIGAGAIIMSSLAQQLISRFGWHTAYAILGAAVWLIAVPTVAALLKDRPQDVGLLPDGAQTREGAAEAKAALQGLLASQAWCSGTFWLLACAFFLLSASVQGCMVHLAAMLTDRGISAQTAALGSSLIGAAVLIARVGIGYLLDRLFAPRLAALCFATTGRTVHHGETLRNERETCPTGSSPSQTHGFLAAPCSIRAAGRLSKIQRGQKLFGFGSEVQSAGGKGRIPRDGHLSLRYAVLIPATPLS